MALGLTEVVPETWMDETEGKPWKNPEVTLPPPPTFKRQVTPPAEAAVGIAERHPHVIHKSSGASLQMSDDTQCFVFNLQTAAVQRMLDFDMMCKRKTPSVAALIYAFGGTANVKVYWGTEEI